MPEFDAPGYHAHCPVCQGHAWSLAREDEADIVVSCDQCGYLLAVAGQLNDSEQTHVANLHHNLQSMAAQVQDFGEDEAETRFERIVIAIIRTGVLSVDTTISKLVAKAYQICQEMERIERGEAQAANGS